MQKADELPKKQSDNLNSPVKCFTSICQGKMNCQSDKVELLIAQADNL